MRIAAVSGLSVMLFLGTACVLGVSLFAQTDDAPPLPIVIDENPETLEERLQRKITLDVREMNVVDVIKFLALKGDCNIVTSGTVGGRVTLYLKSVSIKDALDIVLLSNNLAYAIRNDIVHVMSEQEYLSVYGKNFKDKSAVKIVQLKYVKPDYVLATLESVKSEFGKIIIDEDTGSIVLIDLPGILDEMMVAIEDMDNPLQSYLFQLKYAQADIVAEKLRSRLEGNKVGTILADERSNQVIVRALPERLKEIEALIQGLDVKTKEVLIDARVLQVIFKPNYDVGIDWSLAFRDSPDKEIQKVTFRNILLDEDNLSTSSKLFSNFGKIAIGNFSQDALELSVRALRQVSDTKILANPKILVTNNEEAKIHVGDTIPYIISTTSGTGDNAITSEDVRFVDVGLKLQVTPAINDDGFVTMRLKPEISSVVDKISSQGGGIPQINKTEVETTVMVKDGNTIVLGGLKKDDKTHVRKSVPVLGDVPILKVLFSSTSDSISSTEIVIFITPHIVTGVEPANDLLKGGTIKPLKGYEDPIPDQRKQRE